MTTGYLKILPSVGSSLSTGWKKMTEQFLPLLLIVVIVAFLSGSLQFTTHNKDFSLVMLLLLPVAMAYAFLFLPVIKYGSVYLFLKAARSQKVEIIEIFDGFRNRYIQIIVANLLVFALVFAGILMLIIPGIIIKCRLAFVPYLVMDKKMDAIAAVEESWRMTRGHGWTIFFLGVVSFFLLIGGILVLIFGVLVAAMWVRTSFAVLYQSVLEYRSDDGILPILGVNEVPEEPVV